MGNIWMVSNGEKDEDLPVLASFLLLQINTLTRTNLREKRIYLACTFRLQSTISGSQGRSQNQNPWRKAAYWLSQRLIVQLAFLYSHTSQDHHLSRDGTVHSGLGPSTSINIQDNPPQTRPQPILIWEIPQCSFPSLGTIDSDKLTVKVSYNNPTDHNV